MNNSLPSNSLKRPEAILFDTDNTLYEYSPANKAAESAVCLKIKNLLGIDKITFYRFYNQAKIDVKQNLANTASGHSRLLYFQRMIELLGLKAQLLLSLDLEQTFWRTFLANAPLFPGVVDTLMYLKSINVPIAIVTDLTSHIQMRKLTYFGLEDTFDAVVTSEEVGSDKPDIRNFELVFSKLGISDRPDFWMVGDDPFSDIYGASSIGAITFQKIHSNVKKGTNLEKPDYTFNNYYQLLDIFKELIDN